VSFCVLFVCICVLYYCHRVATRLQLTNVSYIVYLHTVPATACEFREKWRKEGRSCLMVSVTSVSRVFSTTACNLPVQNRTEQNNRTTSLCLHDSPGRTCHTATYIPPDYLCRERQNWAREDGGRAGSIRLATCI
jgi:hypothetical protein